MTATRPRKLPAPAPAPGILALLAFVRHFYTVLARVYTRSEGSSRLHHERASSTRVPQAQAAALARNEYTLDMELLGRSGAGSLSLDMDELLSFARMGSMQPFSLGSGADMQGGDDLLADLAGTPLGAWPGQPRVWDRACSQTGPCLRRHRHTHSRRSPYDHLSAPLRAPAGAHMEYAQPSQTGLDGAPAAQPADLMRGGSPKAIRCVDAHAAARAAPGLKPIQLRGACGWHHTACMHTARHAEPAPAPAWPSCTQPHPFPSQPPCATLHSEDDEDHEAGPHGSTYESPQPEAGKGARQAGGRGAPKRRRRLRTAKAQELNREAQKRYRCAACGGPLCTRPVPLPWHAPRAHLAGRRFHRAFVGAMLATARMRHNSPPSCAGAAASCRHTTGSARSRRRPAWRRPWTS